MPGHNVEVSPRVAQVAAVPHQMQKDRLHEILDILRAPDMPGKIARYLLMVFLVELHPVLLPCCRARSLRLSPISLFLRHGLIPHPPLL
jgi:hypothetical protein